MFLSWNEVKKRALEFSKEWENEINGNTVDFCYSPQTFPKETSVLEFLFDIYRKYTKPMFTIKKKGKREKANDK